MKTLIPTLRIAAIAVLLGSVAPLATGMQGTLTAHKIPTLTPEQHEILSHMSIVYLNDGQGGTVKTLDISGINVRIHNGLGATNGLPWNPYENDPTQTVTNGLGNLIVGYNELGGNLAGDDRTGSHNIVFGRGNSFSNFGGIVGGSQNTISGTFASLTGGQQNTVSGSYCSISGGVGNATTGWASSVSGGSNNTANDGSSVLGGTNNTASNWASVSGGFGNTASAVWSSVSGGHYNSASGNLSVVSGGYRNTASGSRSSVSGGYNNTASGVSSSVSGGAGRVATSQYSWVGGSYTSAY